MSNDSKFAFRVAGGLLTYAEIAGNTLWEMPLDRIVLLAEFTTGERPPHGYELVFWSLEDGELHRAIGSAYADGIEVMVPALSAHWQWQPKLELANSAQWASRVVWPQELEGREYFALEEVPPATWREKIRKAIFGAIQQYLPTETVSEYLRRYKPDF
ncbi:MAG: hypothetical protein ACRD4F_07245 [Candidatus Angelobacter sp.]